jgi:hypothetical protein
VTSSFGDNEYQQLGDGHAPQWRPPTPVLRSKSRPGGVSSQSSSDSSTDRSSNKTSVQCDEEFYFRVWKCNRCAKLNRSNPGSPVAICVACGHPPAPSLSGAEGGETKPSAWQPPPGYSAPANSARSKTSGERLLKPELKKPEPVPEAEPEQGPSTVQPNSFPAFWADMQDDLD